MHSVFPESLTLCHINNLGIQIYTIHNYLAEGSTQCLITLVRSLRYPNTLLGYTLPHYIAVLYPASQIVDVDPVLLYCRAVPYFMKPLTNIPSHYVAELFSILLH